MAETDRAIAEYQSDHDLLVVLNERVGQLTTAVEKKNDDHEGRIRILEVKVEDQRSSTRTWRYALSIGLSFVTILCTVIGLYVAFK